MADFHQRLVTLPWFPCLHFYYMLYLSRSKDKSVYTPSSLDLLLLLGLHWYVTVVVCLLCLVQG
ncbi:hypothetical protein H5410_018826 [Solanum commersonii]|uniref:Uncharacterized protein n=1 Tax=Solanum commersonii TaxID=4109 RepID=A0A9J6A3U8_SOLCO|nr:hypothetical protein H5410_018826 [Solanum commersonii]